MVLRQTHQIAEHRNRCRRRGGIEAVFDRCVNIRIDRLLHPFEHGKKPAKAVADVVIFRIETHCEHPFLVGVVHSPFTIEKTFYELGACICYAMIRLNPH